MAYSERFDAALALASQLHRHQVRKGSGVPYITHLLAVAAAVGEAGGSEDQAVAALLHDALEDCLVEHPDLRDRIADTLGPAVLGLVEGLTDTVEHPKPPWRPRKEAYLAHLRRLPAGDPVWLVALADKLHNARAILRDHRAVGEDLWDRFAGGREGTLWYYRALADLFAERFPHPLTDELVEVVDRFPSGRL